MPRLWRSTMRLWWWRNPGWKGFGWRRPLRRYCRIRSDWREWGKRRGGYRIRMRRARLRRWLREWGEFNLPRINTDSHGFISIACFVGKTRRPDKQEYPVERSLESRSVVILDPCESA